MGFGFGKTVCAGDDIRAASIADDLLMRGFAPADILQKGVTPGIYEAGKLWQEGTYFLPGIMLATEAFKEVLSKLERLLKKRRYRS